MQRYKARTLQQVVGIFWLHKIASLEHSKTDNPISTLLLDISWPVVRLQPHIVPVSIKKPALNNLDSSKLSRSASIPDASDPQLQQTHPRHVASDLRTNSADWWQKPLLLLEHLECMISSENRLHVLLSSGVPITFNATDGSRRSHIFRMENRDWTRNPMDMKIQRRPTTTTFGLCPGSTAQNLLTGSCQHYCFPSPMPWSPDPWWPRKWSPSSLAARTIIRSARSPKKYLGRIAFGSSDSTSTADSRIYFLQYIFIFNSFYAMRKTRVDEKEKIQYYYRGVLSRYKGRESFNSRKKYLDFLYFPFFLFASSCETHDQYSKRKRCRQYSDPNRLKGYRTVCLSRTLSLKWWEDRLQPDSK